MDKYIYKCHNKVLRNDKIHLLGVVSAYIASKVYDLIPIQLNNKEKSLKMKMKLLLKFNMLKSVEKIQEIYQYNDFSLENNNNFKKQQKIYNKTK